MSTFKISHKANNSVWATYRLRNVINTNPDYQRQGDVWTLEKRQLLIDTIFNQFDVPKIYLHKFLRPTEVDGKLCDYSIVDGKQRLTAIWDFIDGKFPLADDFEYYADSSVEAKSMTYKELSSKYPDLKSDFDSFQLIIVEIETDDEETIEEMFSRLNEAVTLNAPEKRNAYGGPIPKAIRDLSNTDFFVSKLAFGNKRFKHYDLATKFLLASEAGRIIDTKKVYLDKFVKKYASHDRNEALPFVEDTSAILDLMKNVFVDKDVLLRSTGMVMLYHYLFRQAKLEGWESEITRGHFLEFDAKRLANRAAAKEDLTAADYDLLEFDKYNQSPNDKYAVELRLKTLLKVAFSKPPMAAYAS